MTAAEKRAMRARITEINLRFQEMVTAIETEKRSLTPEEVDERSALEAEKHILQLRLAQGTHEPTPQPEMSSERAFDNIVSHLRGVGELHEDLQPLVRGGEFVIPTTRAIQDSTTTGSITPLTIGDIIEPLEKGLILDKVGAKMQYGLTGAWNFPIVAGVEASVADENAEVSDTTISITKLSPTPKRVTIAIPVSNRALDNTNGMLLSIVQKQLPLSLSRLLNKWMFQPTAISAKVGNGCFVAPTTKLTTAASFTYADMTKLKGAVMKTGVVFDGTPAYVCSAATYAELEATPRGAGGGMMIIENGKIGGFPVFITEFIGDKIVGFGVFSYQLVGQFGEMRMTYDPYTGAKKNLVYFVFNSDFDLVTLRNEAFGTITSTKV